MVLLPSLITLHHPADQALSAEDIFSSTLGSIFTDDLQNQHGTDPTTTIVYTPSNASVPPIELRTADVDGEDQRRKFAHYLWNAGVLVGEIVGGRQRPEKENEKSRKQEDDEKWKEGEWWLSVDEEKRWAVKGERVLELGAGVGLGGIMAAMAGADEIFITDYPATPILSTLEANVKKNIPTSLQSKISVHGHQWGDLSSPFATANAGRFTRIFAADCLWMPHEHTSLARSMLHFLSDEPSSRVYVVAGFHTGRAKMAPFFDVVEEVGLEIEDIFEMDAEGRRRAWAKEREGGREDVTGRKKWLVVARLKRKA
ncbi:unnamed protein product [Periconia digitata]|uniref:Nicotinamide N-methyltransferase n=1 Tax=Periconia digitata TaxID=1303443 RepID=A0A9W4UEG6_9PLEO|nr:unnamed protein product [Periconia digitata]